MVAWIIPPQHAPIRNSTHALGLVIVNTDASRRAKMQDVNDVSIFLVIVGLVQEPVSHSTAGN